MKWVLLETAPNQIAAEMWVDFLQEQGVPAFVQPQDAISFLGVSNTPCRIMVPEDKLEEAKTLLEEFTSAEVLDEEHQEESDADPWIRP